jgi:iron complex transport system permease protein
MKRLHPLAAIALSAVALWLALGLAPWITRSGLAVELFWLRLPRVLFAAAAGATLATAGLVLQAVLRNPLATPYTLGISSGAALGAATALKLAPAAAAAVAVASPAAGALAGALLSAALVYLVARARGGDLPAETLLLAGVAVSLLAGAGIATLQYLSDTPDLLAITRWTLGGLDAVDASRFRVMAPLAVPGLALLLLVARDLDIAALDDESARALGVDPVRARRLAFVGASVATAGVVAAAGPIAFVGLIVPHVARALGGPDHRVALPCSFLLGGAFLVLCDAVGRTVLYPVDLPINIITSAIGCPTFIWILARR